MVVKKTIQAIVLVSTNGGAHNVSDTATSPTAATGQWDELRLLVGGQGVVGAGPIIEVVDPATEQVVAAIGSADPAQVDAAVAAAKRQPSVVVRGPASRASNVGP